jgi:HEAT repeat protein
VNNVLLHSPDEEVRRAGVAALRAGDEELALLVEALGDESWRVRKEAVGRAAGWAERDRAAAALVIALAEPENVGRRNAAVEALARIGGPSVAPLLSSLRGHPEHRKLIVDTLGLIGDRGAVAAMIPSLADEDPNVRAATAEALGRIGGAEAEAALVGALGGSELLQQLACLAALHQLGARLSVEQLAPLVEVTVLRPAVLAALGKSSDAAAAPHLARHLGDPSRAVREAATVALEALGSSLDDAGRARVADALKGPPEETTRQLVEALLEGTPATRRAAATVLGLCGTPAAVRPLALALGDSDVEEAAAAALVGLGAAAVGPLAAIAEGAEPALRLAIFRLAPSLPSAGDGRLLAALESALAGDDAESAAESARALGSTGGREVAAGLFAALAREEIATSVEGALISLAARFPEPVRAGVLERGFAGPGAASLCRVLGACGSSDDAALLEQLLRGEPPPLRAAAAEALARLSGEAAFERLSAALADRSAEVRAAAARAVSTWPAGRHALAARELVEEDPLVRAVIAAALAAPGQ